MVRSDSHLVAMFVRHANLVVVKLAFSPLRAPNPIKMMFLKRSADHWPDGAESEVVVEPSILSSVSFFELTSNAVGPTTPASQFLWPPLPSHTGTADHQGTDRLSFDS